ncbi:DUF4377 domain-containing protein [Halocynthiibacter namhaensis]|uniref:DUF4377 domain-containing protein n=1 Tax=Halocynthiibacter namhaensis TaxID=1290553 RepID=UPI00068B939F|nr:DUF4377 domain-containing protein [Halocynthiibacter namhaensis]
MPSDIDGVDNVYSGNHPEPEAPVLMQVAVAPQRVDCHGMMPMKCLVVDGELFYDGIEDFTHIAGTTYQLEVEKSPRAAPGEILHDVGYYRYRLVRVISAIPVVATTDP